MGGRMRKDRMDLSQLGASIICSTEGLCNSKLGYSMPYQARKVQSATQVLQISKKLHHLAQYTEFSCKKSTVLNIRTYCLSFRPVCQVAKKKKKKLII